MAMKHLALIIAISMITLAGCSASVVVDNPSHYGYYDSHGRWHRY